MTLQPLAVNVFVNMASRACVLFAAFRAPVSAVSANLTVRAISIPLLHQHASIHTSRPAPGIFTNTEFDEKINGVRVSSRKWERYNEVVYPPINKDDPWRPAEVCHARFNIKYSPLKMWYLAVMVRGMTIDEAIKQMSFQKRKGSLHIKEVLEEAQEMAVRDHNVEFKSNLWITDSFVTKGRVIKGVRKHLGPRRGIIHYKYCHYYLRLQEGRPPKHYYPPPPTGHELMEEYIREQRARRIQNSL